MTPFSSKNLVSRLIVESIKYSTLSRFSPSANNATGLIVKGEFGDGFFHIVLPKESWSQMILNANRRKLFVVILGWFRIWLYMVCDPDPSKPSTSFALRG